MDHELVKLAGLVEDFVKGQLGQPVATKPQAAKPAPITYAARININPGAVADIPSKPFGPNNEVNFMFVFRYHKDARKNAGSGGLNAVTIYSDIGKHYSDPSYIQNAMAQVMSYLKKYNPNAKLGKWGMTAFSGGGSVVENLLAQRQKLESTIGKAPDAIVMADAGHTKLNPAAMSGFEQYAREAADPKSGKRFISVHSAIVPTSSSGGTYTSTTQHSQYLLDRIGVQRQQASPADQRFAEWDERIRPRSVAEQGGLAVLQSDDKGDRRYDKQNSEGTSGWVHMQIAKTVPYVWQQYLGDWN